MTREQTLIGYLLDNHFKMRFHTHKKRKYREIVFTKYISDGFYIKIWTSIEAQTITYKDTRSIRVCLVGPTRSQCRRAKSVKRMSDQYGVNKRIMERVKELIREAPIKQRSEQRETQQQQIPW